MKPLPTCFALAAAVFTATCFADTADLSSRILPQPQALRMEAGSLVMAAKTSLALGAGSEGVGRYFAERLRRGTGWSVPVLANAPGTIHFEVIADPNGSPEAYSLKISPAGVELRAASAAGIARGAETLLQLMPPEVYGSNRCETLTLPYLTINDAPQFPWRGAMLDVSRKFQDKETILKLLDGLAACKLNIFHWHLTDDQGWRLPIEGYPKLTGKGPAYSRADIKEVVERAAALGITILPEIDMPGHSGASCRAYPKISTPNDKGQPTGTMNPGADASYAFIEAVMKDVAAQFPNSKHIHLGADEVGSGGWTKDAQCKAYMQKENLKNNHELYIHFVNRAVAIARKHGFGSIAWDEAFDPKNDPELIIMSWRGMGPGIAAAKAGRTVIATPNPPLYINHANTRSIKNPRAYSAHPTYLNQGYFLYADTPAIPAANRSLVLGGEACLWGECITGPENMFIHMFPRVAAAAENLWLPREKLDWNAFVKRLQIQNRRFQAMGIPYFWEPETLAVNIGGWKPGDLAAHNGVIDIPLKPLAYSGEQEFFITQTTGGGQFRVECAELLKDGVVVDTDRHRHDSSVYVNVDCMYLLKNPDATGVYTLRLHATPLNGDCAALIQHHAALAPDGYSKQCAPGSGANRSKQTPTR
ncbi:MAG: beta-N-acetylhexosaminidase [Verrucomicrobia bacterium]|nr:beta-N-acetylhexosaminidase [Verrucomicrobiota bacterium]